jgi:hypothetical protein
MRKKQSAASTVRPNGMPMPRASPRIIGSILFFSVLGGGSGGELLLSWESDGVAGAEAGSEALDDGELVWAGVVDCLEDVPEEVPAEVSDERDDEREDVA